MGVDYPPDSEYGKLAHSDDSTCCCKDESRINMSKYVFPNQHKALWLCEDTACTHTMCTTHSYCSNAALTGGKIATGAPTAQAP